MIEKASAPMALMGVAASALPSLGNLAAYSRHVNALPMLSEQEEAGLAEALRDTGSLEAAKALVLSHLRLVVKIAKEHSGYGLAQEDLIQEGNVGLMLAVKKYDLSRGVRLAAYAAIWIRSEIQEYVLSNWRTVKIGSAKGLRKLFFNLRRLQEALHGQSRLSQRDQIAKLLDVEPHEVDKAMQWFAGGDVPLVVESEADDEPKVLALPAPENSEPDMAAQNAEKASRLLAEVSQSLAQLSPRERQVVSARYLDNDQPSTLAELSIELGVSLERVRQIEAAALKKMRATSPGLSQWL